MRIKAKADRLGLSQKEYLAYNYGDDTLLLCNSPAVVDRWVEDEEMFGFRETVAADATFLMKRVPYGYSYLGRMVMSSINREAQHEPANTLAAAAAFATRRALLNGHPLADRYYAILDQPEAPERMRRAIRIARQTTDPVALTYYAYLTRESRIGYQLEDLEGEMSQLAYSPVVDPGVRAMAEQTRERIHHALQQQRKRVTWAELEAISAELTPQQARSLIKDRSYTR
jgi:hypothetical protein